MPSDLIGTSTVLETPHSPILDSDHGKISVVSDLNIEEESESDTITNHSNETSNEMLHHRPNALEGNVAVPTSEEEPDSKIRLSKRPRLVPKQYQIDEEVGIRSSRLSHFKESDRLERRHPTPKSPPHSHRKYHHSSSCQRAEKHRYQRDRLSSPTICKLSQSPPLCSVSPPHRHYSSSPPIPRYVAN